MSGFWLGTAVKWSAQALVVLAGASAIFQDLYTQDPKTGRRRPTRTGWIHLTMLAAGFTVFMITTRQERLQAEAEKQRIEDDRKLAQAEAKSLAEQKKMLDGQVLFLRRLILVQEQLEHLEISWDVPGGREKRLRPVLNDIGLTTQKVRQTLGLQGRNLPLDQDPVYLEPCLLYGDVSAARDAAGNWIVSCQVARPQGVLHARITLPAPELGRSKFQSIAAAFTTWTTSPSGATCVRPSPDRTSFRWISTRSCSRTVPGPELQSRAGTVYLHHNFNNLHFSQPQNRTTMPHTGGVGRAWAHALR